jgi:hypothetical protein
MERLTSTSRSGHPHRVGNSAGEAAWVAAAGWPGRQGTGRRLDVAEAGTGARPG